MASMGLEADCSVRVGRKSSDGKALLEGEVLLFRGDLPLRIPFEEIRELTVAGGTLTVNTADQDVAFELGPHVAERWLRLIKEPKGLFEKLDVGPQSRVAVVDVTDSLFLTALRERTLSVAEGRVPEGVPVVFFGAETRDALRKLPLLRTRMMDAGTLWIVRPKASKDISEADVFGAARSNGLVDAKVVTFSKNHVAHKCVIPVEMRGQATRPRPPIMTIPPSAPLVPSKKGAPKAKVAAKAKPAPKAKPAAKAKPKPAPKKSRTNATKSAPKKKNGKTQKK
jgi:hypothetical protein